MLFRSASSDHLVRSWYYTYGLPIIITNSSNNYGPWQFPEKLIPMAILKALSNKNIPMYGDGENIRDWLYVDDHAEAILRSELGNEVTQMTSKELKRDLLLFAKNDPVLFLELVNDENINIRNMGIKAVENNIITLSNDQRTFNWSSTGRKLITVPFDENPYSALAAWFKTDEGIEVYQTIEKKLK